MRDRMIDEANLDFEQSQTYLDRASSLEQPMPHSEQTIAEAVQDMC